MAEVPEVEILTRDLREAVVGRTIRGANVLQEAAVRFPAANDFSALIKDRVVMTAERRAKYILLPLSDDLTLAVHLMLWGTLKLVPSAEVCVPDTLIVWQLDRDEDL